MAKLLLINAPMDKEQEGLYSGYEIVPPSAALAHLEQIVRESGKHDVLAIDGNHEGLDKIKSTIKDFRADYHGFSSLFFNHENSEKLARYALEELPSTKNIFGNVNAFALERNGGRLLKKNFVHYVVGGLGEEALLQIINGGVREKSFITIPFDKNKMPVIDFNAFKKYMQPWNSKNKEYDIETISPFPMSPLSGCIKALRFGKCNYCTTPYDKIHALSENNFWKMAGSLNNKFNVDFIFITGDNFMVGDYPSKVLRARPSAYENIKFRFYGHIDDVDKMSMQILKNLNVKDFFPGQENVDKGTLTRMNKLYRTIDNWDNFDDFFRKYDVIEKEGISFYMPWLAGYPGENETSLHKNKNFMLEMLKRYDHLKKLYASIVVPIMGTKLFSDLETDPTIAGHYREFKGESLSETTCPDYGLLIKLMVKHKCSVSFNEIQNVIAEVQYHAEPKLGKDARPDNFGKFNFEKYKM